MRSKVLQLVEIVIGAIYQYQKLFALLRINSNTSRKKSHALQPISHTLYSTPTICLLFVILLVGCNFQPPLDPNDPADGMAMQAEVMQRNLNWASELLSSRTYQRQLTREIADAKLQEYAENLSNSIPKDGIDPTDAWRYGEVLRTAKQWDRAEAIFKLAAETAQRTKDEDRYVNDTLHYAEALAENGKVNDAILAVRSTFSVSDKSKAPILFGTLYQVVPAAEAGELKVELAKLLEDAIDQHRKVIVDSNSEAGASFISTRQHHVMKAWQKVIVLYRLAGRADLADEAIAKRDNSGMIGI